MRRLLAASVKETQEALMKVNEDRYEFSPGKNGPTDRWARRCPRSYVLLKDDTRTQPDPSAASIGNPFVQER